MRIVIAAAICAALLGAGPVFSATAEREQLLQTLGKAYPAAFKAMPLASALTSLVRDRLAQANPGREEAIGPIVAAHALCTTQLLNGLDMGTPMVAAVRASNLSDEDLSAVVAIYSDPEIEALLGKLTVDPPYKPTDADIKLLSRLAAKASDPAMKRFLEVVTTAPEMRGVQTEFSGGLKACNKAAAEAAGKAGLKSPDPL